MDKLESTTVATEPSYGTLLSIDLSSDLLSEVQRSNDILDTRSAMLATLSIAVAGAASAAVLRLGNSVAIPVAVLVAIVCCLALRVLWVVAKSLAPVRREQVIGVDRSQIRELFLDVNAEDAASQAIGQYVMASECEAGINSDKSAAMCEVLWWLKLQVVFLAIAVAWPVLCKAIDDAAPPLPAKSATVSVDPTHG